MGVEVMQGDSGFSRGSGVGSMWGRAAANLLLMILETLWSC